MLILVVLESELRLRPLLKSRLDVSKSRPQMAKPRRSVQFQHRGSNNHDGGKLSPSDSVDAMSEPGSPTKLGMNGKAEVTQEVHLPLSI